jgi:hypothetical protein
VKYRSKLPVDSFSYTLGKVSEAVLLVSKGVRPVSHLTIRPEWWVECKNVIEDAGLLHLLYHFSQASLEHTDVYIFKYPHLEKVIQEIKELRTPLAAWCYGHLFGYAESEIAEFIKQSEGD